MPKCFLLPVGSTPALGLLRERLFKTGIKASHYGPKGLRTSAHCFAFDGVLPELFLSLNPGRNSRHSTDLNVIRAHLAQPSEEP